MTSIKGLILVDDDIVFNLIHLRLIKKMNFADDVRIYGNSFDALRVFRLLVDTKPDLVPELILLDINMPKMDGWAFLDELSKFPDSTFERCKVIILSSSISFNDIERSQSYKMVIDFISKPLTESKLNRATVKLLEEIYSV